jgi:hypothetical protein
MTTPSNSELARLHRQKYRREIAIGLGVPFLICLVLAALLAVSLG